MEEGESAESFPSAPRPTNSYNPGSYEQLNERCKEVFPMCFEGAKIFVQKGLSSHFSVSHTVTISPQNTGYKFGTTYAGSNQNSFDEPSPVLLGDTDASGNTSATIVHRYENIKMKLLSQVQQGQLSGVQGTVEHRGRLATATLSALNVDIVNESGYFVGQYLRRLTDRFDVGAEIGYSYGWQVPGGQVTNITYAARYNHPHWIGSITMGAVGLNLSYFHQQHPNLSFGVEYETHFRYQESVTTFAYKAEIPEEGVVMKASIDTNWSVGGVLEKRLSQVLPFTLIISGFIDHVKNVGKFGIGLIIGG